jgi:hypothetical protein
MFEALEIILAPLRLVRSQDVVGVGFAPRVMAEPIQLRVKIFLAVATLFELFFVASVPPPFLSLWIEVATQLLMPEQLTIPFEPGLALWADM